MLSYFDKNLYCYFLWRLLCCEQRPAARLDEQGDQAPTPTPLYYYVLQALNRVFDVYFPYKPVTLSENVFYLIINSCVLIAILTTSTSPIIQLVCPPPAHNFSWEHAVRPQEKLKTIVKFRGGDKAYHGRCGSGQFMEV